MAKRKKGQLRAAVKQPGAEPQAQFGPGFIRSFPVVFLLLFAGAIFLPDKAADALSRFTAASSGLMLWVIGLPVEVRGRFLALDQFRVEIIPECTVLYPVVLLMAFVLAYPASQRKKVSGMLTGTALLLALNTLRIAAVVYVGSQSRTAFHILHTYFGQVVMMLAVIGICLAWGRRASGAPALPLLPVAWKRLVFVSAVLFSGWLLVDKTYVAMNDALVEAWFSWQGREIVLQRRHLLYFETFNLPFFASLALAAQRVARARRVKCLLLGATAIWLSHVLFRLGNACLMLYGHNSIFLLTNSVVLLSQYLLTFVLWYVLLVRQREKIQDSAAPCRFNLPLAQNK